MTILTRTLRGVAEILKYDGKMPEYAWFTFVLDSIEGLLGKLLCR